MLLNTYKNASARLLINGHESQNFKIGKSVRQGRPLSTVLYVICLDPLLEKISKELQGEKIKKIK